MLQVRLNGLALRNIKAFACFSWILTDNEAFIELALNTQTNSLKEGITEENPSLENCIWFCFLYM